MIKYYYRPLWQVYSIITTKISGIKFELAFQISFKANNNLVSFNKLVLTHLVFGLYPKITGPNTQSLSITQCIIVI